MSTHEYVVELDIDATQKATYIILADTYQDAIDSAIAQARQEFPDTQPYCESITERPKTD